MRWSWWSRVAAIALTAPGAIASLSAWQAAAPRPPELLVTRLDGARDPAGDAQGPQPGQLSSLTLTSLDDRAPAADLDGPQRVSLSLGKPQPLRELLGLMLNGTPFSMVTDDAVAGTFSGELKNLTLRQ